MKAMTKKSYKLNNYVLHPLFLEIFLLGKKLKNIVEHQDILVNKDNCLRQDPYSNLNKSHTYAAKN